MKRERLDKQMSQRVINKVLYPLAKDLGSKHLWDNPSMTDYDHENKTLSYDLGRKKHGDKRMRTTAKYEGIYYRDGEKTEGETRTIEIDHRVGWSIKHDNRLVQNDEVIKRKVMSYEEEFNKIRSLTSLDVAQSMSATAQGEIMGFGGSVTTNTSIAAHTEVETEKFKHTKREIVIEDEVRVHYPGPILDEAGRVLEEGEIWLVERPLLTLQTITPMTQWGIWDCGRLRFNLYDWAGNRGIMPSGEHWNVLEFAGLEELLSFMRRELILQYPWSDNYKPSDDAKRGMDWLADEQKRWVGPVEWDRIRLNENVSALEPSIVTSE